ncbi:glycosyltransferase [Vibrio fluvialis]|nr:glycosyltransferase [Vibrio fluvialis]
MKKKILIVKQGRFGGTDRILDDFHNWCAERKDILSEIIQGEKINTIDTSIKIDYLVLPTSEIGYLWRLKNNGNTKVLIWSMGHDAVEASFFNRNITNLAYKYLFGFLYYCFKRSNKIIDNIVFTDQVAFYHEFRDKKIKREYVLPIPIKLPKSTVSEEKKRHTFFWLGRVDKDFKVWALIELLKKLNNIKLDFEFNIIGDGDGLDLIVEGDYKFKIIKHGHLSYENMEAFLKKDISLMFAMGTSALEGAKNGIPTIIVNPLFEFQTKLETRWIYNSAGYSLGEFKLDEIFPEQTHQELSILINEYLDFSKQHAKLSHEYAKQFDREKIYCNLMDRIKSVNDINSLKSPLFFAYVAKLIKRTLKR